MNSDEAEVCYECGTKFPVWKKPDPLPLQEQNEPKFIDPLPASTKWRYILGAWAFVILVCLITNPQSLLAAPFFPIGLIACLPNGEDKAIAAWMKGAWIIGWVVYALLSVIMFQVKKRGFFFPVFGIFCILLSLNISGCNRVMNAASQIH
jgi:hypothetical protein